MLFSGSLRQNLDPVGRFVDTDMWTAIEQSHLKNFVSGLKEGLDYDCGEGGVALRWVVHHSQYPLLVETVTALVVRVNI